jgi:hypothetical protein
MMDKIPEMVFLTLGVSRSQAAQRGMVGCGLQLNPSTYDYMWAETTFAMDFGRAEVRIFLTINGIPFSPLPGNGGIVRIPFLQMETYLSRYQGIKDFLDSYRKNRFLRLGSRSFLEPWELNSRDAFLLGMSNEEFLRYYVVDPRGAPTSSMVTNQLPLHSPVLLGSDPEGLPVPQESGWI